MRFLPVTRPNKIAIDVVDHRMGDGLDVMLVFERGVLSIRGEKYVIIFLADLVFVIGNEVDRLRIQIRALGLDVSFT